VSALSALSPSATPGEGGAAFPFSVSVSRVTAAGTVTAAG
jgi:hypothetical protein